LAFCLNNPNSLRLRWQHSYAMVARTQVLFVCIVFATLDAVLAVRVDDLDKAMEQIKNHHGATVDEPTELPEKGDAATLKEPEKPAVACSEPMEMDFYAACKGATERGQHKRTQDKAPTLWHSKLVLQYCDKGDALLFTDGSDFIGEIEEKEVGDWMKMGPTGGKARSEAVPLVRGIIAKHCASVEGAVSVSVIGCNHLMPGHTPECQ
jgi:hypothetical protein